MMLNWLLPLLLAFFVQRCAGLLDWCYQSQVTCDNRCKGPAFWADVNSVCKSSRQSPINIVTRKTLLDDRLVPFSLIGYLDIFTSTIKNSGFSVTITIPHMPLVKGGNLPETYKAVQLHLHWGRNGGPGSEHTIDGEQYPMELHIVHMKETYDSLADALADPTGIAVFGFFFEESGSDNWKYDPIINALDSIRNYDENTTVSMSLSQLIPPERLMTSYYRYHGSLTIPGCGESVVWTVFKHTIALSRNQLSSFSRLTFPDGTPMVDTFRPVQPVHGRTVGRSASVAERASAALMLLTLPGAVGAAQPN